jgi:hypothetical protein
VNGDDKLIARLQLRWVYMPFALHYIENNAIHALVATYYAVEFAFSRGFAIPESFGESRSFLQRMDCSSLR